MANLKPLLFQNSNPTFPGHASLAPSKRSLIIFLALFSFLYIFIMSLLPSPLTLHFLESNEFFVYLHHRQNYYGQSEPPVFNISQVTQINSQLTPNCHLPNLRPFHSSILPHLWKPKPLNCSTYAYPYLFTTDLESSLIQVQDPWDFHYSNCCYKAFARKKGLKRDFIWSNHCIEINQQVTKIPASVHQFVIQCSQKSKNVTKIRIIDAHGFLRPLNNSFEGTKNIRSEKDTKLNLVIFGLDGVSHMNFLRTFRSTYKYLRDNLSAIEMHGYGKVGDNTFPNLIPALTGHSVAELKETCWGGREEFFDACPFIWKNYSENGYLTAFGESTPWVGMFNFNGKGFYDQPTDYFHHTLATVQDVSIGHTRPLNLNYCIGPRLFFEEMLANLKKMAVTAHRASRPYFQMIWSASITHDFANDGNLGDTKLRDALKWFEREGHLNKTIFILMSDHGIRWGKIHDTVQGKIEERMPLLYFVLPHWIPRKYPEAVRNLKENAHRLTTPFDFYETLQDLLSLEINDDQIRQRSVFQDALPRGISLFVKIPLNRTCADASIDAHWCICQLGESIEPGRSSLAREAANDVVNKLNQIIENHAYCAQMTLGKILSAEIKSDRKVNEDHLTELITDVNDKRLKSTNITLSLTLQVKPSSAIFDATTTHLVSGAWIISGSISRTNLYGNQSACVEDDDLRGYCYCI